MKKWIFLSLFPVLFLNARAQNKANEPAGFWYGQLDLMGMKHEILLLVSQDFNPKNNKPIKGKFIVELLNPADSSNYPVSVTEVVINQKSFAFKIAALNVQYTGVADAEFQNANGTFEQHGMKAPLTLGRTRFALPETKRPQTPIPPFVYTSREVSIPHIKADFKLAGTLTLPADTTKPFPIVVMATGSGPQNRNEEILEHKLFWVLADHLAKNGIGSLRFDDRGVGQSGGKYEEADLLGFSEDLESAFDYLRKKTSFGKNKIGLLGHSEGAMHAWMITKRRKDIDFLISLAGPAKYGREVIQKQQYDIVYHSTSDEKHASWNTALFIGIIDILDKSEDVETTNGYIREFITAMHKNAPKHIQDENPLDVLLQMLPPFLNNPWGRQFVVWNPEDYIPFYEKPVLFIIGEQDLQVHAKTNYEGYMRLQNEKSKAHSKAYMLPGLNHLLQTCVTCSITEYGEIEETVAPVALQKLVEFLKNLPQS